MAAQSTKISTTQIQHWLEEFTRVARGVSAGVATEQLIANLQGANAHADAWQAIAEHLIRADEPALAARLLSVAMTQHTDRLALQYWRGNALRMNAAFVEAERDFRVVLEQNPAHRDAAFSLAFMLREQGRIYAAADTVVVLARQRNDDRDLVIGALEFLRECGAHAQAGELARHAAKTWPDDARVNSLAGEILLALGDFDSARTTLRRALDLDPSQSTAWLRLATCGRYTHEDADVRRFRNAIADVTLEPMPRICASFSLGKALDDLGDYAHAARVLSGANASIAAESVWDATRWHQFVDAQIAAPVSPSIEIDHGFVPVFVIGLPRAGTTLVATRLGRSEQVHDRGELNWIAAMHEHLRSRRQLQDPHALASVARLVAAQMRRDDAPARYIIDKNPLNFRYLGFIQTLFPQALIIHCQRGERDVALSLWQQHFAHSDLAFSYRLDWIAAFLRDYRRLMTHWRKTVSLPCLDVHYEMMVANEAGETRRLVQFLGLPDATTAAGESAAVITTASVWQARQPVYARSVDRWKNYAELLPELERLFSP